VEHLKEFQALYHKAAEKTDEVLASYTKLKKDKEALVVQYGDLVGKMKVHIRRAVEQDALVRSLKKEKDALEGFLETSENAAREYSTALLKDKGVLTCRLAVMRRGKEKLWALLKEMVAAMPPETMAAVKTKVDAGPAAAEGVVGVGKEGKGAGGEEEEWAEIVGRWLL
jgi:hypothetical protein